MSEVHLVVPAGIDDPTQPSGGNSYDRRISSGLAASGWIVHEHPVDGSWPHPDDGALAQLARSIATVPDGSIVIVDGLIGSAAPSVLVPEGRRLRLIVLIHLALDTDDERLVLSAACGVITTSSWSRDRLLARPTLTPGQVHVAAPGVDPAPLASSTSEGTELLCVAAVTPLKGHDILFGALAELAHLPWRCVCVGSLDRDRAFVARLRRELAAAWIADRVGFRGPLTGGDLGAAYAAADVLVLASRVESYGMVVTEALARGMPVIAPGVGGVPEALGRTADGGRPGVLVDPDDPPALTKALDEWLTDADQRRRLRHAARARRNTLTDWSVTTDQITRVLTEVASR